MMAEEASTSSGRISPAEAIIVPVSTDEHENEPRPHHLNPSVLIRWISLAVLIVQNASLVLFMRYARTRPGDMFLSTTAVVMAEVMKLTFCLGVTLYEHHGSISDWLHYLNKSILQEPVDFLKISVPAIIYLVQNNLLYVALSNLDAAFFQVTYQLKLLTTALFSVTMLRKQLSSLQWLSLVVLFAGIAIVQLQPQKTATSSAVSKAHEVQEQNATIGLAAVLVACVMSGFACVYFEKLLKQTAPSIYLRNIQLGLIGVVFGLFAAFYNDGIQIANKGFFYGYDVVVLVIIMLQSLGGILVAVVVKYADNILKGFATSSAIIISCVVSVYLFDVTLSVQFIIGTVLVVLSIYLYAKFVPRPVVVK